MKKFRWTKEFTTGLTIVDQQHKKLVDILSKFYDVLTDKEDRYIEHREEILKELVAYTEYHFTCEEELFAEIDYFGTDTHVIQHNMFTKEVLTQMKDIQHADIEKGKSLYSFLSQWLLVHILQSDKLFCEKYLATKK